MSENRELVIRLHTLQHGRVSIECHLMAPHKGGRGRRMMPLMSWTRRTMCPYATELTEAFAAELLTALQLVAAGWYESEQLF